MSQVKQISTPITGDELAGLRIGDRVEISGDIYTARDAAGKRLVERLDRGEELPFDITGQILYFAGPAPAPPGRPIGSVGPTTSGRMDIYSPRLINAGLKGMIGKGAISDSVVSSMVARGCVYFVAVGGAGALLARRVRKAEVIAYNDLGAEAVHRLTVENFPVIVAVDLSGADIYKEGFRPFKKSF